MQVGKTSSGGKFKEVHRRPVQDTQKQHSSPNAFDLSASELGAYARRLAKLSVAGGDPNEQESAWNAVAFQAQGLVHELSTNDAYTILRALASAKILRQHSGAQRALLEVLSRDDDGALKPRKLVTLWLSLDRADVALDESTVRFFRRNLTHTLVGQRDEKLGASPQLHLNADVIGREWKRLHAVLEAGDCTDLQLQSAWESTQASTLADGGAVRALSVNGLTSAFRAAALAKAHSAPMVADDLVKRFSRQAVSQSRWLDGWAASHVANAAAKLGLSPGRIYDPLRPTLLSRCALAPSVKDSQAVTLGNASGLADALRVASALALFDVHDVEIRDRLASWLLLPLPATSLAKLASDLASVGLNDASDPKIARHIRARSRSSELKEAVGADVATSLLDMYAQSQT